MLIQSESPFLFECSGIKFGEDGAKFGDILDGWYC